VWRVVKRYVQLYPYKQVLNPIVRATASDFHRRRPTKIVTILIYCNRRLTVKNYITN
jgi:hypothetical protein